MKRRKIDPVEIFRQHNGILRTAEAVRLGIHTTYLYKMRDEGVLESLGRGVFRLAVMPDFAEPDLVLVAKKNPSRRCLSNICLVLLRIDNTNPSFCIYRHTTDLSVATT